MKFKLSVIQQAKVVTFYLKNKKNKVSSTFTFSDTHPNYANSLAWLREVTIKELRRFLGKDVKIINEKYHNRHIGDIVLVLGKNYE